MDKRFLIVSNGRTGSTWLTTLLGGLPDTYTDYEFKWNPTYPAHDVHYIIPDASFSCGSALDGLSNEYPIIGSKLVLDLREHTLEEYASIAETIESNIRIIHLHRKYTEILVSYARPTGSGVELGVGQFEGQNLSKALKEQASAEQGFYRSSHLSTVLRAARRYAPSSRLGRMLYYLRNANNLSAATLKNRVWIPTLKLREQLVNLLSNDLWIATLADSHPYYRLQYSDIKDKLPEVVEFVGSNADRGAITEVLENPVTKKVLKTPSNELLENYDEVSSVCDSFEKMKQLGLDVTS